MGIFFTYMILNFFIFSQYETSPYTYTPREGSRECWPNHQAKRKNIYYIELRMDNMDILSFIYLVSLFVRLLQ